MLRPDTCNPKVGHFESLPLDHHAFKLQVSAHKARGVHVLHAARYLEHLRHLLGHRKARFSTLDGSFEDILVTATCQHSQMSRHSYASIERPWNCVHKAGSVLNRAMREQGTPLGHMAWSGVSSACIGLGVIMHFHDIRVIHCSPTTLARRSWVCSGLISRSLITLATIFKLSPPVTAHC